MDENKPAVVRPTVGRMVYYKLSTTDVECINKRRQDYINREVPAWVPGAQAHVGNSVEVGQIFPCVVVGVSADTLINGQVFLDGNDTIWLTSATQGQEDGQWDWMPFQKDQQARLAAGTPDASHKSA